LNIFLRIKGVELTVIEVDSGEEKQKGEEVEGENNRDWKERIKGKVFGRV
jgi:hypothetical protein